MQGNSPHRSGILRMCARHCLQVYKAVRNGVQVVAVKIFTDQVAGENQARYTEAFRREIFILRSCHDRNIVQFLGACLQVRPPPTKHPLRCADFVRYADSIGCQLKALVMR